MLSLRGEIENKKKELEENNFASDNGGFVDVGNCTLFECLVEIKNDLVFKFLCWKNRTKRRLSPMAKGNFKLKIWRIGLIGFGLGLLAVVLVFAWCSKDLPNPTRVVRKEGYASRIYDRNGELLYDVYKDAKRTPVTWEEIPDYLKKATVSVEDKDFYQHQGFDPLTPLRMAKNVLTKGRLIGGSTLTQQLVKNVLLTSERTVVRKIKEFILAVQIEAKYSKDEILLMYLN